MNILHHPSPKDFKSFRFRKAIMERIETAAQMILDELKPTRAQLEHGLQLHYDAYVAELMGCIYVVAPVGYKGDRLEKELDAFRTKLKAQGMEKNEIAQKMSARWREMKPFESAFDEVWRDEHRSFYNLTGIDLAVQDSAGHQTFPQLLRWMAATDFVYRTMPDVLRICRPEHLKQAREEKKIGVLSHLQSLSPLWVPGQCRENLDLFYGLGVRGAQLTHGHDTALGSDCFTVPHRDGGLTPEGRETIRRMNELGVIVDIAHAGRRTALETIEASEDPIIDSHTACETVFDDADHRNISDESIRALVKKGGIVGIYVVRGGKARRLSPMEGYPPGTSPMSVPNTFDDLFRHLAHAIEVAGIDHVGIGTDITYLPDRPPHALDWTNWPYWTVGMVCRGLKDEEIRKILGENFYRLAIKLLDKKPWGRLGPGG